MLGREPVFEALRRHAGQGANEILEGILRVHDHFLDGRQPEDDTTLVVLKFTDAFGKK